MIRLADFYVKKKFFVYYWNDKFANFINKILQLKRLQWAADNNSLTDLEQLRIQENQQFNVS